jgi:hypothetical protein
MTQNPDSAFKNWEKVLNPASVKSNLISAALFIAAFETLKSSIVSWNRRYNSIGDPENLTSTNKPEAGGFSSPDNPSLVSAVKNLVEMGVFNDEDARILDELRRHRNELAHELLKFIVSTDHSISVESLHLCHALVAKLDRWWIMNIEVPLNPEFDGCPPEENSVHSGNMMILGLIIDIALGQVATGGGF